MPTATETVVPAYAFCVDARCDGYLQEKVDGIRTTTLWTNFDLGGPMAVAGGHTERSTEMVRFADESQAVCGSCGRERAISEQERPEYPNVSGHDPMGIFDFRGKLRDITHDSELEKVKRDRELDDLRREMAELKALLSERHADKPESPAAGYVALGQISDQVSGASTSPPKRGPGRPPKPKEG